MDDDSNPPYFQVSFSAEPGKKPVMSTDPDDDDVTEQKEESEDEIEKDSVPQATTIHEDRIEKNPSPTNTTADKDKDQPLPESVPVVDSDACITLSELEDDDTELWLIAVPRHDSVRATLPGSKLGFPPSAPKPPPKSQTPTRKKEQDKKKVGVLRGSYIYQELTSPGNENMRAVFVIQDDKGRSRLEVAKPFARTINVAFDADMNAGDHDAPVKTYPKLPEGLELQYFPIGSKKRRLE